MPCFLYAERNLEKYLAHGRCIEGISPLGEAESTIDCCGLTPAGSFIHAGGDQGEA